MNFVNSSILTGVSTVVKLASNLIITKLVAYFYGANGMFLLGNLANFLTFLKAIATGGIEQGTVKYVSQYENDCTFSSNSFCFFEYLWRGSPTF